MSSAEIKAICKRSLEHCRVGKDEGAIQDGKDFYKFMFGNYPDLRVYFKGAEKYTPEDVQASERFAKQGQRLLLACHIIADVFDDKETFKAYARETVNRHRIYKMDPTLWKAFFAVFVGYLKTKTTVDEKIEKAWLKVGDVFSAECLSHLKDLGLPH
uniref:GLOBIN domain-containing protein n=1 Tax=Syphacia muris TaxID=451379 RepID=A0A0N5B0M0_9BILA